MEQVYTLNATAPIGAQLFNALRQQIITAQRSPGARLSEQEIANAYGISRQPVRETFIRLAAEGLVEVRPQRGTFVCKIDLQEVETSRFVREALESDIVRIAAREASQEMRDALQRQIEEQEREHLRGGQNFMTLDEDFHRTLAEAAGQIGAWGHLQPIKMHMDRVRHLTAMEFAPTHLVAQHRAIVDAIVAKDEDAAELAIRTHLRGVVDDMSKIAQTYEAFFVNR
jgi:DNA-binding GntR family transcriptional regulator